MGPIPVIEPLDELHRGSADLMPSIEMVKMIEIVFEERKERLRGSVIQTRSRGSHRLRDTVVSAPPGELLRRMLRPTIRVKYCGLGDAQLRGDLVVGAFL